MEWAVGKKGEMMRPDAGKLMLPGSRIRWEIHMHAIGEEVKDNTCEIAIYFYPEGPGAEAPHRPQDVRCHARLGTRHPPNEKSVTQKFYVMQAPARIENFQPHMHMRGKAMSMEAISRRPARGAQRGQRLQLEVAQQLRLCRRAAPLLPKGTMLVFTAWHDNTARTRTTPIRISGSAGAIARWTKWRTAGSM